MPSTPVTIVTGASRGLGLAIARLLLERGHHVLTLQREPNPRLNTGALEQWAVDLAEAAAPAQRLHEWIAAWPSAQVQSLTMINNAAALSTPGPLHTSGLHDLQRAARVGLEAPLLLSAAFLAASAAFDVPRKLLNISSGLGRFAMAGSASYCAVKAGLDHFTRAVALEQASIANGAKAVSLAPGVIDTDMQVQLRGADPAAFAERSRFVALKQEGRLDSPGAAAMKVLAYLDRPDFGIQPIGDVRDAA